MRNRKARAERFSGLLGVVGIDRSRWPKYDSCIKSKLEGGLYACKVPS